jgi:hypothetical protein
LRADAAAGAFAFRAFRRLAARIGDVDVQSPARTHDRHVPAARRRPLHLRRADAALAVLAAA